MPHLAVWYSWYSVVISVVTSLWSDIPLLCDKLCKNHISAVTWSPDTVAIKWKESGKKDKAFAVFQCKTFNM